MRRTDERSSAEARDRLLPPACALARIAPNVVPIKGALFPLHGPYPLPVDTLEA